MLRDDATKEKLIAEKVRAVRALADLPVHSEEYGRVLDALVKIIDLVQDKATSGFLGNTNYAAGVTPVAPVVTPEPQPEQEPEGDTEEAPEAKPKKTKTKVIDNSPTRTQVREAILALKNDGVAVRPIIEMFTPDGKDVSFSSIPEDKYPEVMEEIAKYAK